MQTWAVPFIDGVSVCIVIYVLYMISGKRDSVSFGDTRKLVTLQAELLRKLDIGRRKKGKNKSNIGISMI